MTTLAYDEQETQPSQRDRATPTFLITGKRHLPSAISDTVQVTKILSLCYTLRVFYRATLP